MPRLTGGGSGGLELDGAAAAAELLLFLLFLLLMVHGSWRARNDIICGDYDDEWV